MNPPSRSIIPRLVLSAIASLFCLKSCDAAEELVLRHWTIDGVAREGLVHVPPDSIRKPIPVIFAFHGHGGSMQQAARSFQFHALWPEAIVVYLQGLPTRGLLTDPAGQKNGWQASPGADGDRDLRFFDAVVANLKSEYNVDDRRVYATGHSNGGGFTYLLWATRGHIFAAYAPVAAVAGRGYVAQLHPAPVITAAGEQDELVKFSWQERMFVHLRRLNGCGEGHNAGNGQTLYASSLGCPVLTYVHNEGHQYPPGISALIVEFFKAHPNQSGR